MPTVLRPRAGLRALSCAAVLSAVLVVPLPGAASWEGVASDVAAAREGWKDAVAVLAETVVHREAVEGALARAEAAEQAAAEQLDIETALLVGRERELAAAEGAHADAVAASAVAVAALRRSVADHERAQIAALDRRADLGRAAATAYAYGDPRAKVLNGVVHALDGSRTVGDFITATERLAYVTIDARVGTEAADAALHDRTLAVVQASHSLEEHRRDEQVARSVGDDARDAAERQRARRDEALAGHDAAIGDVERLEAALTVARARVVEAETRHEAALGAVRALGWRAGVPGTGDLVWPVDGHPGSGFGQRVHPIDGDIRPHLGVDIGGPTGLPVVAAADGRVVSAGVRGGYGLTVVLDHGAGRSTLYAHLSSVEVRAGQEVAEAQRIGAVGSTGRSTGPHLHFEVRQGGSPTDPMRFFR